MLQEGSDCVYFGCVGDVFPSQMMLMGLVMDGF